MSQQYYTQTQTHRTRSHTKRSYSKSLVLGTNDKSHSSWRATTTHRESTVIFPPAAAAVAVAAPPRRDPFNHPSVVGSKIILSQLPPDSVGEQEVEDLFTKTIGPVFDCYLAHNSQGRSKGVAVVHFQRSGDAVEARRMFNGKIIDGRRPLKIELIVDPPSGVFQPIAKKEKTLAERLSGPSNSPQATSPPLRPTANPRRLATRLARSHRRTLPRGPRRTKKSAVELDLEMESYMADRKPTVKSAR